MVDFIEREGLASLFLVLNILFGSQFATNAVSVCFETELVHFYQNFPQTSYLKIYFFHEK